MTQAKKKNQPVKCTFLFMELKNQNFLKWEMMFGKIGKAWYKYPTNFKI